MADRRSKWLTCAGLAGVSAFFFLAHFGYGPIVRLLPSVMTYQWNTEKGGSSIALAIAALCMIFSLDRLASLLFEKDHSA